jgi:tripartite-type tricarboxylate transporter receptor subunit TctC
VVPWPAGDGTDVISRVLANEMQKDLKVPVMVKNVVGAAGLVGAQGMSNASPDGYTFGMMSSGHITHQTLYKRWELLKATEPIANVATASFAFMVHPSSRFKTMQDLLSAIREKPDQITMATGGLGSPAHMCWEVFNSKMGGNLKVNHVPYKSGLESAQAVMANQVDFASSYIGSAFPIINQKQARALAITSASRLKVLPDTPTIAESVLPKFEYLTLLFYGAPRGTPAAIVNALYDAVAKASRSKEMLALLDQLAHQLDISPSPSSFSQQLQTVITAESKLIQDRGISTNT